VKVEDVANPKIVDPTDVVVRQPGRIITRTMPLEDTPHGDAIFDRKEDRAINVMLEP